MLPTSPPRGAARLLPLAASLPALGRFACPLPHRDTLWSLQGTHFMCRPSKYRNESLAKRSQRLPVHLKVGATVAVHLCTKHLEHQAVLGDDGSGQALARVGITWTVREMPRPRPWAPRPQSGTPVQESALQQTPRASPAVVTCDRLTTARFEPLGRAHDKPERQRLVQISLPPGPGPHSGRPWTQSSLPLGLCTSPRSRQSAVASSHVWHTFPQLCPQLWVLHAPGLPPQLCSPEPCPEPRPSPWDHLPSGPRWGARVCARRGAQGSGDVWHLHPARSSPPVPVSFPLLTSPHAYPFS